MTKGKLLTGFQETQLVSAERNRHLFLIFDVSEYTHLTMILLARPRASHNSSLLMRFARQPSQVIPATKSTDKVSPPHQPLPHWSFPTPDKSSPVSTPSSPVLRLFSGVLRTPGLHPFTPVDFVSKPRNEFFFPLALATSIPRLVYVQIGRE